MYIIPNGPKIYQHFIFQGPPKYSQIGFFWFENIPSGNTGDCNQEPEVDFVFRRSFSALAEYLRTK
jgi:hypothetical protein